MKHTLRFLALFAFAAPALADYLGDFAPATTAICGEYTTFNPSTGAPFTLAGTPALSVYKIGDGTNSATESTTGVTHAEDVDTRTGLNRVCVDTSADGTFYSAGGQYSVVITTGTVNSVSVVGSEVKSFSLNKVAGLRPATAGRTLVVDAAGLADANTVKLGPTGAGTAQTARDIGTSVLVSSGTGTGQISLTSGIAAVNVTQFGGSAATTASGRPEVNTTNIAGTSLATLTGAYPSLGITDSGTAQAGTATTLQLRSAASFTADNRINGASCLITGGTGTGESLTVSSYVNSTDTATMSGTWPTTPDATSTYICFGTSPSTGGSGLDAAATRAALGLATANLDTQLSGIQSDTDNLQTRVPTSLVSGRIDASVGAYQTGLTPLQPTVAGRTLDVTATGEGGVDWANVGAPTTTVNLSGTTISTTQAITSVSGAVGSVSSGGITAASFAADAITAAKVAPDVTAEITTGLATSSALTTVGSNVTSALAAIAALNNVSVNQIRDMVIEDQGGGVTFACALSAVLAYAGGDLSTTAGNSTYKDPSGTENRITGIVSSPGNRLGTITCPTLP